MRVASHPLVLAAILAGLLLYAWSIVAVVPADQWLAWVGLTAIAAYVAARRRSTRDK
jgi:hypothetical protein